MKKLVLFTVLAGIAWNIICVLLIGGDLTEAFHWTFLTSGIFAALCSSVFTIWSRLKNHGDESIFWGITTYYLGIIFYWIGLVVFMRIDMVIINGGWTGFDLKDNLGLIFVFITYGTLPYGVLLIPLNFLTRKFIWNCYRSETAP